MITYDKVWKYNVIAFTIALVLSIGFGLAYSQSVMKNDMQPNEQVFADYPSDGTAYNEIHRYYGSCEVFGEVAAKCYAAGYALKKKSQISNELAEKYWIMSQGQMDVCNMMFNKATYDQFMGEEPKEITKLWNDVSYACKYAIDNIDKRSFNRQYKGRK